MSGRSFKDDAEQLRSLPNEWFAVCYFYAAYHVVRASLMSDPVFDDPARLARYGAHWLAEDRFNDHHNARRGREISPPGVSDLVKALYPEVAVEYMQLHSASIAVRYGLGLAGYDQEALMHDYNTIAHAAKEMKLAAQ